MLLRSSMLRRECTCPRETFLGTRRTQPDCQERSSRQGESMTPDNWRRAYLAVVKSNGGQELNLLLPSVALTLSAVYNSIMVAVQQVRDPRVLDMHQHPTAAVRPS